MPHSTNNAILSPGIFQRARENLAAHQQAIHQDTDRMFAVLMAVQWVAGVAAAIWVSPRAWVGSVSEINANVWAAIFLGGAISIFPIALAVRNPGAASTRYVIATGQMLMSALLIHLTGGRIETHFHVFGSLAFLAFYRDRKVLIPATVVIALDHFLRGLFWPQSVYGVLFASQWRWLEHAGWVLFEDAVLFVAIKRSVAEMWDIAVRTAQTTELNETLEQRVADRTAEVLRVNQGLQREIADRELAEQALLVSEEEHRSIFDNATMGIYRSTVDGKLVRANNAFAQMLGYDSVEEVLQCDLQRDVYYYPDQRAKLIADRAPSGGSADGLEIFWKKKDGEPIWVQLNVKAIPGDDGKTRFFDTCVHEVTERVRAEESLQEANQRALKDYEQLVERIAALGQTLGNARELNTIFRALRDFAVVSVPCDGLVISLYDQEKETRHLAYCWTDQQEFDSKDVADIPVRDGMTGRAIKSGAVIIDNNFHRELQITKTVVTVGEPSSDQIPRSALSAPMTIMGRTVGCVEVQAQKAGSYQHEHATAMRMAANLAANAVENVSLIEREQAKEEQLRQSQKMEAVGKLAGGIAHDFNNLLTAITGYSELTLRDLKTDTPLYSKVTEIKKAGERAASLTRQLLAFSRKQILQPKVLDLNAVIPDMEKMLQRLIGEDVVLETVLDRSLGQVKADPGQIEQIIMNLCVNARDAMPNGGRVTIETNNVSLNQAYRNQQVSIRAGNYVMLSVSDNGCGMDAETQARIFEPFFTTKELGKGTGLGLSTVYGIVKQSEGTIWVYSEVGKGTTFKIYLPRVDEAQSFQEHANKVSLASRGHETILIVEDEEIVLTLSTEILEKDGYRVLAAANGREGLRLCQEFDGPIDLLITDVVMPGMSGRELAELAANIRPDMHVLYMSGFTDDAIVRHGVLDDGVFFIQKPFSPDSLAIKTRSVLDHFGKTENRVGFDLEKTIGRDLGELNHGHTSVN
jgi:PAS domain S-box-containing protein